MYNKKKAGKRWYKDSAGTSHRFKYNAARANLKLSAYKKRLKSSRKARSINLFGRRYDL